MNRGPWIVLEPYYGGSHRILVDGLRERLGLESELWALPARKWKWRMRGAALFFAERWRRERPAAAGIFTSSLLDAAALRGLLPPEARGLPLVLYFHENQLNYPVQVGDARDYHFGWTNIQSALAADRVLWNSAYNRDSFLAGLDDFLRRMPDARPACAAEAIAARSVVLPVPLDLAALRRRAQAECGGRGEAAPRLLWNHRWEHDKDPEAFFAALRELAGEGIAFELSVLGERFADSPAVFADAERDLASHIKAWGYKEDRESYLKELLSCDLVVSTARHEFQGLAVLEAAACGCEPLVVDDLVYPEIWPARCRYPRGHLAAALRARLAEFSAWRNAGLAASRNGDPAAGTVTAGGRAARRDDELAAPLAAHDWETLRPRWAAVFAEA